MPLLESEAPKDPFVLFNRWFRDASEAGALQSDAVTLATATNSGAPSARMVLFKGVEDGAFDFYSNYGSRKGRELAQNKRAALVFFWSIKRHQVRVSGTVRRLTREASAEYFHSRPRGAQLSALASRQSRVVASRGVLEKAVLELATRYPNEVPLPRDWGGYALTPRWIEFWENREDRLFFFSSRRRHTRCGRDWSSDVCSSDLHAAAREGRDVVLIEPKDVGRAAGCQGRQDAFSVAGREGAGAPLDDPNPRIGREVGLEHAALDARLAVVRPGHGLEADLLAPIPGAGPTARGERGEEGEGAPHASRAPEASKKWKCRLSSLTPTRSPTRSSSHPGSRATSVWPPASRWTSVSAPCGSTMRISAFPTPLPGALRATCSGRTPSSISPS